MLKKRIIPCLDIKEGRTVKGVNFVDLVDAGDPVKLAKSYADQGADELVFLDIMATVENRSTLVDLVFQVAAEINIPFTVGGGINSLDDAAILIRSGADKVSINSAAIKRPQLITEIAAQFGKQCLVVAIDIKLIEKNWKVFSNGGRINTGMDAITWAKQVTDLGCGEILLTSMNNDGSKTGFAIDITEEISQAVNIPVIASGGAGKPSDFINLFKSTSISAGLAASIFHFGEIQIPDLKNILINNKIPIRI